MSIQCEVAGKIAARAPLNFFERYLTAWVALCIVVGIVLGQSFPSVFKLIGGMEIAKVNLPVGLLIWVMIIPMLLKIDFKDYHKNSNKSTLPCKQRHSRLPCYSKHIIQY